MGGTSWLFSLLYSVTVSCVLGAKPFYPLRMKLLCSCIWDRFQLYIDFLYYFIKYKKRQTLSMNHLSVELEFPPHLEEPLWIWKGPVKSNSISSGRQLPDRHILLSQEPHQTFAVVVHPAVAVCPSFAQIKLNGILGHLVLAQHSERPHRAKAQQPTYNLHPKLYLCLHLYVKIDEEKEIWGWEKKKDVCYQQEKNIRRRLI